MRTLAAAFVLLFSPIAFAQPDVRQSVDQRLQRLARVEADLRAGTEGWSDERLTEAIADRNAVADLGDPRQRQEAINLLGVIYMRLGRYAEALKTLQDFDWSVAHPDQAIHRYNLGRAYERNGRDTEALKLYRAALEGEPVFTQAEEGLLRLVTREGIEAGDEEEGDRDRAEACMLLLASGKTPSADACFRSQLPRWRESSEARPLLAYLVRRYTSPLSAGSDLSRTECVLNRDEDPSVRYCLDLDALQRYAPKWGPPLDEIRKAVQGNFPIRLSESEARSQWRLWLESAHAAEFIQMLNARGDWFRSEANNSAGPRSVDAASRGIATYAAAWLLESKRTDAARSAADLLASYRGPQLGGESRRSVIRALSGSVADREPARQAGNDREKWQSWSWLYASVGDALSTVTGCRAADDRHNPLYYWLRALDAEARANGKVDSDAPFRGGPPVDMPVSSSVALNRRIADCYKDHSERTLYRKFDNATKPAMRVDAPYSPFEDKLKYHLRSMTYLGGLLKSMFQAGAQQAIDTPRSWDTGAAGFGQRLASSHGARIARQAMALGLDTVFHQEPRFARAPYREVGARIQHTVLQTFITRSDRMTPQFSVWRVGSAFGSELLSNVWRPQGSGIGDGRWQSALIRGAFVLLGDTASNLCREFLPRRGRIRALLRHLQ